MLAIRIALVMGAFSALAGCSTVEDPVLTASTAAPVAATASAKAEVDSQFALGRLPSSAGRILSVRQSVTGEVAEQTVVYQNRSTAAGENTLSIELGPSGSQRYRRGPSQSELQREMQLALPDARLTFDGVAHQNGYGVYGLATGTTGRGEACVFAWQQVGPEAIGKGYGMRVRLRFCDPKLGAERLAVLMAGLQLKPVNGRTIETLAFAQGSGGMPLALEQAQDIAAAPVAGIDPAPTNSVAGSIAATARPERTTDTGVDGSAVVIPMPDES